MHPNKLKKLFGHHSERYQKPGDALDVPVSKTKSLKPMKNLSDSNSLEKPKTPDLEARVDNLEATIREKDAKIEQLTKELERLRVAVRAPVYAQNYRASEHTETSIDVRSEGIAIESHTKDAQTSKKILEAFTNNMYMRNLDREQLTEIVKAMFLKTYSRDDVILREGEPGDFMFLVEQGELELSKGNEIIGKLVPGKAFGEHAFLYDCARSTNVRGSEHLNLAIVDCKLWVLSKPTFEHIMLKTMLTRQKTYIDLLNKIPLFKEIPDYNLCKVIDIMREVVYLPRQIIYLQGAKGEILFVIKQGTVEFYRKRVNQGDSQFIRVLSQGSYFGERSLLGDEYYNCDAYSGSNGCTLLQIEQEAFASFFGSLNALRADLRMEDRSKPATVIEPTIVPADYNLTISSIISASPERPKSLQPDYRNQLMRRLALDDLHTVSIIDVDTYWRSELVVQKSDPRISYTLKQIKKRNIVNSNLQNNVLKEKRLLSLIDCNFVIKLFKTFRDRKYVYLLMEACLGGNMTHVLREQGHLNEESSRFYVACIIEALQYLHNINIIYRDLRPSNIVIDEKGYCKLTNFMNSKQIETGRKTFSFCGTPEYLAPEVIMNNGHDYAVDYWGIGILIYETLTGKPPFYVDDPIKTYNVIMKGFDSVNFPSTVSRNAQNLVRKLCRKNPNERLGYAKRSFFEVQKNKWFEGFNWQQLKNLCLIPPVIPKVKEMTESADEEEEFHRDDEIPPDETSGWDKDF